jgi:UDP-N-acetylmuramate dehydrogenase
MIEIDTPIEGLELREDEPLAPRTTLRIGGRARVFAEVKKKSALAPFFRYAAGRGLPLLALGKGSNILIPDEGWYGAVFILSGEFREWQIHGDLVHAGGGVSLMSLAVGTAVEGLSGLEDLSGIPSTFGGAVRINAGAFGTELFDLLVSVEVVTGGGTEEHFAVSEIRHGYRFTDLIGRPDVVTGGVLRLWNRPADEIASRLASVRTRRKEALPSEPNAGSIFKNPPGLSAGKLLDECGLKGTRCGGAEVSQKHANVIVNTGGARARDVLELMATMQEAVRALYGITLVPEIDLPGNAAMSGPSRP